MNDKNQLKVTKKAYQRPEIKEWGTVVSMTAALGMTFITDVAMTGSMEDMGMGMGMGMGMM